MTISKCPLAVRSNKIEIEITYLLVTVHNNSKHIKIISTETRTRYCTELVDRIAYLLLSEHQEFETADRRQSDSNPGPCLAKMG
jgi:hypothetical protein